MRKLFGSGFAAAICIAIGLVSGPARAADQKVIFSMPNLGVVFAYAYIAQAMGYWKNQGLDVELTIIDGAGGNHALVAGDIQFAGSSGLSNLLAAASNLPTIAITDVHSQLDMELLLSPEAVKKSGLDPATATKEQRAKALKGLIIACAGGPATIPDGVLKYIISGLGHLDPDKDVTITYLAPPAVTAAIQTHKVDGILTSPPYTTVAEQSAGAVKWVSGVRGDLNDLNPFVYTTISAQKPYCEKNPDICTKFLAGVKQAIALMKQDPDKGLELVRPVYKDMDPTLLKIGYLDQIQFLNPTGGAMSEKGFTNTQNFAIGGGMLKPAQARTSFEGVAFTNAYLQ